MRDRFHLITPMPTWFSCGKGDYVSWLLFFISFWLVITVAPKVKASDGLPYRFSLHLQFGGHMIAQKNVSDVLTVNGYRSVEPSDRFPDSTVILKDGAVLSSTYPGLRIGASYRWGQRVQGTLMLSGVSSSDNYYCNIGTPYRAADNLRIRTRQWQSDITLDYILHPYPRKKKAGFQFLLSGGVSIHHLNEKLDFTLPDSTFPADVTPSAILFDKTKFGVSALFSASAELQLGRRFSLLPARIVFSLPVLRPSYGPLIADNGSVRRSLSGRNYDTGGIFYFFGGSFRF